MKFIISILILSLGLNNGVIGFQSLSKTDTLATNKVACPFSQSDSNSTPFSCPKDSKKDCQKKYINRILNNSTIDVSLNIVDIIEVITIESVLKNNTNLFYTQKSLIRESGPPDINTPLLV